MQGVYDSDSVCQWDKSQTNILYLDVINWGKWAGLPFTSQQNLPKSTKVLHLPIYLTGPRNNVCTIGYVGPGPGDRDIPIVWYIGPKYWWHQDEPSHVIYLQPRLKYSSLSVFHSFFPINSMNSWFRLVCPPSPVLFPSLGHVEMGGIGRIFWFLIGHPLDSVDACIVCFFLVRWSIGPGQSASQTKYFMLVVALKVTRLSYRCASGRTHPETRVPRKLVR